MESEMCILHNEKTEESSIFSRNSEITELLQLCLQPNTNTEMEVILLDFWDKFDKCVRVNADFCEGDIFCSYVLDYVYKHNDLALSAVSRSVYAYMLHNNLPSSETNRNKLINCSERSFVSALDRFTNLHSVEGEKVLKGAVLKCVTSVNLGLLHFFLKFGLLEFPTELNKKGREMVAELVSWFNSTCKIYGISNLQTDEKVSMKVDEFLNQMKESDISFRRTMLIFICICIIFEYQELEKLEKKLNTNILIKLNHSLKKMFILKFVCLDTLMEATVETFITFNDIDQFQVKFLSCLPNEAFGLTIKAMSRKIFSEAIKYYNPRSPKDVLEFGNTRSLKDLARCKIRESLQCSTTLPKQVYKLPIPVGLKEFLLFGKDGIWEPLNARQQIRYVNNSIIRSGGM